MAIRRGAPGRIHLLIDGRCTDWRFRDQVRDAAASAPRNVAEGFGLFKPRLFARHVRIARGSLAETKNHIQDARARGLLTSDESAELLLLCHRALGATTGLLRYLDSLGAEAPATWPKRPASPPTTTEH
jgi:four helix bundle protein